MGCAVKLCLHRSPVIPMMQPEQPSSSEQCPQLDLPERNPAILSGIKNVYEQLVLDQLFRVLDQGIDPTLSTDRLEDIACLALNQLPARYIRHGVDFSSHLTTDELSTMHQNVVDAVDQAMHTVQRRQAGER